MSKKIVSSKRKIGPKKMTHAKAKIVRIIRAQSTAMKVETEQPNLMLEPPKAATMTKEIKKLQATIAKLTAGGTGEKPKQLYFDEVHLAGRWAMSIKHVRTLRYGGVGPKVTYFGRSVRYRLRDIVAFEKGNTFTSRSDMEVRKARQK